MASTDVAVRPRRSAFAAAFLSFIFPGLGHAYLGRWLRALLWAALPILGLAALGGLARQPRPQRLPHQPGRPGRPAVGPRGARRRPRLPTPGGARRLAPGARPERRHRRHAAALRGRPRRPHRRAAGQPRGGRPAGLHRPRHHQRHHGERRRRHGDRGPGGPGRRRTTPSSSTSRSSSRRSRWTPTPRPVPCRPPRSQRWPRRPAARARSRPPSRRPDVEGWDGKKRLNILLVGADGGRAGRASLPDRHDDRGQHRPHHRAGRLHLAAARHGRHPAAAQLARLQRVRGHLQQQDQHALHGGAGAAPTSSRATTASAATTPSWAPWASSTAWTSTTTWPST